jgi:RimJ/RimL family protein N-acetyltransferase
MDLPRLPPDTELRIETARLSLEPVVEAHAREVWELFADQELHRFVPFQPGTLEETAARCARWATRFSPKRDALHLNWLARERATGRGVGHFQAGVEEPGRAVVGYLVLRARQGRGYATEGMGAVLGWLHGKLGVRVAEASCDTRNSASIRLALRLGMRPVRLDVDADRFKGIESDEWVFRRELG